MSFLLFAIKFFIICKYSNTPNAPRSFLLTSPLLGYNEVERKASNYTWDFNGSSATQCVPRTMTAKILHHLVNKYMKPMGQISLLQSSAVIRMESARS